LGYHPSLAYCVSCNKPAEKAIDADGYLAFSPERGGLICPTCGRPTDYYIRFHRDPYIILAALQTASLGEAVAMPTGHADALSLLEGLTKFLSYQTGVRSELKSLQFLEKLRTSLT
jgi:recombinational DNA repair protein (RecF pathway)